MNDCGKINARKKKRTDTRNGVVKVELIWAVIKFYFDIN